MSSSDEDDVLLLWWHLRRRKQRIKKKRKYWINPAFQQLVKYGANVYADELKLHPLQFKSCYRLSPDTFQKLLNLIEPSITKRDTNYREAISAAEKLLITLRYLATGCSFVALSHIFMRGNNTIGIIVKECSEAIWRLLQPLYMPVPNEETWKSIAKRYYELWDLPNCIGSVDGKHCRIKKFDNTGSLHYNYKNFFSVVLMACADADGIFTTIDVGEAGRFSDGAVFRSSNLGKLLDTDKLHIPKPTPMPNDTSDFPFYMVGDEAFPLKINLMRPYPKRVLDNEKRIFNYRISRGRKSVECTFGMLASKFEIFQRPIMCHEDTAIKVIKAACILHNFIKMVEGNFSVPQISKNQENQCTNQVTSQSNNNYCSNKSAHEVRDYLKKYFLKPENALPWQENYSL